jgi:glutathione S-transferase
MLRRMQPILYYMPFSPWSHKARCALRHHALTLREHAYVALLEEPLLRFRLQKWRGRVTVPVLFTSDGVFTDSWEIALYADQKGSGSTLIPDARRAQIGEWNAVSERLLSAVRSVAMLRAVEQPEAVLEVAPPLAAKLMTVRGARLFVRMFNAKYGIAAGELVQYQRAVRDELQRVQRALADGRRYLTGELSYADIAIGIALNMLGPLPGEPVAGLQRLAFEPELSAEFASLRAWRDDVHAIRSLLPELDLPPSAAGQGATA